jgi:hypothetical protein
MKVILFFPRLSHFPSILVSPCFRSDYGNMNDRFKFFVSDNSMVVRFLRLCRGNTSYWSELSFLVPSCSGLCSKIVLEWGYMATGIYKCIPMITNCMMHGCWMIIRDTPYNTVCLELHLPYLVILGSMLN